MLITTKRAEDIFPPAARYAKIAKACSVLGINIAEDNYETVDALVETIQLSCLTFSDDVVK